MTRSTRARVIAAACTIATCLVAAPAAYAGTINYTIEPSPAFTIQDNGNGIVKVTYNGCVTAGERQTLLFTLMTNVSADSNATFSILKEEGIAPGAVFNPPSVFLQKGQTQTFNSALGFTFDAANNDLTTFRIKLDPESGEGLGQGAGVMVSVPCILAAAAAPAPTGTTAPPPSQPTAGFFPAVTSQQAAPPARCISTPTNLRLRAGETSRVRVVVRSGSGQTLQGALVRATYPGATQRKRTDANGVATFSIRARRAGRLVLQSDVCFGADRVRVLAARAVGGAGTGRFTG